MTRIRFYDVGHTQPFVDTQVALIERWEIEGNIRVAAARYWGATSISQAGKEFWRYDAYRAGQRVGRVVVTFSEVNRDAERR